MHRFVVLAALGLVACYPKAEQEEHAQFDSKADDILAAIAAVDGKIDTLTTAVAALQADIDGLETDVAGVQGTVDDISDDLATAQTSIDDLTTDVAAVDSAVAGVDSAVAAVDSAVDTVQSGVNNVGSAVDVVDGKVDAVSSSVGDVNASVTAARESQGWRLVYDYDGDAGNVVSGSLDDLHAAVFGGADVRVAVEANTDRWYTHDCEMVFLDEQSTNLDRVTCVTGQLPETSYENSFLYPYQDRFSQWVVSSEGLWAYSYWEDDGSWWWFDNDDNGDFRVRWYVNWNAQP